VRYTVRNRRVWRTGTITAALIAAMCVGFMPVAGLAQERDELQRVYDRILLDPGNTQLNLGYARLAIKKGELRKAIAAYERILARDPKNGAARRGLRRVRRLLRPNVTSATLVFGARGESNPRRFNSRTPKRLDGIFSLRALVSDRRRIGNWRWRSSADLYADYRLVERQLDYGTVSVRTGPVFDIGDKTRVHVFGGAAFSWFDYKPFVVMPRVGLRFEFDDAGPLKFITIRGTYSFINTRFTTRDSLTIGVTPRFVFRNIFKSSLTAVAAPYWRYNGVTGTGSPTVDQTGETFPQRFHQMGLRADLFRKVLPNLTLAVNFSVEYRHFFESVTIGNKQRRDLWYSPGAQAIVTGLFQRNLDLIFSYNYEWNLSNSGFNNYTNQIFGLRILARF
jgi:hypothetical protein